MSEILPTRTHARTKTAARSLRKGTATRLRGKTWTVFGNARAAGRTDTTQAHGCGMPRSRKRAQTHMHMQWRRWHFSPANRTTQTSIAAWRRTKQDNKHNCCDCAWAGAQATAPARLCRRLAQIRFRACASRCTWRGTAMQQAAESSSLSEVGCVPKVTQGDSQVSL